MVHTSWRGFGHSKTFLWFWGVWTTDLQRIGFGKFEPRTVILQMVRMSWCGSGLAEISYNSWESEPWIVVPPRILGWPPSVAPTVLKFWISILLESGVLHYLPLGNIHAWINNKLSKYGGKELISPSLGIRNLNLTKLSPKNMKIHWQCKTNWRNKILSMNLCMINRWTVREQLPYSIMQSKGKM